MTTKNMAAIKTDAAPRWFAFYDPFATFFTGRAEPRFVDPAGKLIRFVGAGTKSDARLLLELGAQAVRLTLLGPKLTSEQWQGLLKNANYMLASYREELSAQLEKQSWRNAFDRPIPPPNIWSLVDFDLLSILDQLIRSRGEKQMDAEWGTIWTEILWCLMCLREIDEALMQLVFTSDDAPSGMHGAIRAAQALANAKALHDHQPVPFKSVDFSAAGKRGAAKKLAADPKQQAKSGARQYWERWQAEPSLYRGNMEWARDMLEKFPVLESVIAVSRWPAQFAATLKKH